MVRSLILASAMLQVYGASLNEPNVIDVDFGSYCFKRVLFVFPRGESKIENIKKCLLDQAKEGPSKASFPEDTPQELVNLFGIVNKKFKDGHNNFLNILKTSETQHLLELETAKHNFSVIRSISDAYTIYPRSRTLCSDSHSYSALEEK
ncbi:MAG: hypothetical protein WCJ92_07040 [Alphaproteobacteria bacterium]